MLENIRFGIVQGRLIPPPEGHLQWFPQEYWQSEFFVSSALGYDYIELIAERQHNEGNPIWSSNGVEEIASLTRMNHLSLLAVCNDYIIDHPITADEEAFRQTLRLLSQSSLLGIRVFVLPLFEKSELTTDSLFEYQEPLRDIARVAEKSDMLVCIETNLDGRDLLQALETLACPNIKCVFDTGNRIALGHDIYSDIRLLGERIGHVHIKDKNEKNENVILGTGRVDFLEAFRALSDIGFRGGCTFETFRGTDPARTAQYNLSFVKFFVREVSGNEH